MPDKPVTDPQTAAALQVLRDKTRNHGEATVFEWNHAVDKVVAKTGDGFVATLEKTGSSSDTYFKGIGYKVYVANPDGGIRDNFNLWVINPSGDVAVNRLAAVDGIDQIIKNTNSGKTSFNAHAT